MNTKINANVANLSGEIASEFKLDHTIGDKKFYMFYLNISRISGCIDCIPVIVNENIIDAEKDYTGKYITISGCVRTYNNYNENDKRKLRILIYARTFEFTDKEHLIVDKNEIFLEGYICKKPIFRETPFSKRRISDVIIAVNRSYKTSDYIPCICWGGLAKYVNNLDVGTYVTIIGRIQSREYTKKLDNGEVEIRTAYELSVAKLIMNEE